MRCGGMARTKPPRPKRWGSACGPFTTSWKRAHRTKVLRNSDEGNLKSWVPCSRVLARACNWGAKLHAYEYVSMALRFGGTSNGKVLFPFGLHLHHQVLKPEFHDAAVAKLVAVQRIENLLAVAAVAHHVVHPQQPQVMADGRLGKGKLFAERRHVALAVRETHEDAQASLVRQEAEQ